MLAQQLLDLFNREYEFSSFIGAGNEISVANLESFSSQYTHIYGEHLTGKTHLLKAWVNHANHTSKNAIYIDANELKQQFIAELNLEQFHFIAIDNIDRLNNERQIELFDLFNHIKLNNRNNHLLTSSTINLNFSTLRDDLKTRIHSGLIFALKQMNELELIDALNTYTIQEGIKFKRQELEYVLKHYTRNLGKLIQLINQLSKSALRQKKEITIPFIKQNTNNDQVNTKY